MRRSGIEEATFIDKDSVGYFGFPHSPVILNSLHIFAHTIIAPKDYRWFELGRPDVTSFM